MSKALDRLVADCAVPSHPVNAVIDTPALTCVRPAPSPSQEIDTQLVSVPLEIRALRMAPGSEGWQITTPMAAQTLPPGAQLQVRVAFTPDGRRRQALGGLQIVSNDSTQIDDPHTPEIDYTTGVGLRAGSSWLLSLMVFFPLLGIPFLFMVPRGKEHLTRWVAVAAAAVPMVAAIYLYQHFDPNWGVKNGNSGLQFIEHAIGVAKICLPHRNARRFRRPICRTGPAS